MLKLINLYKINAVYVKNLFFTYFSQAITALSLIVLTPFLSQYLGIDQFGIYGVILNIIAFAAIFDFGFNNGLLRKYILKNSNDFKLTNSLYVFYIALLLLVIPIVYITLYNFVHFSNFSFISIAILISIIIIQNILILFFETLIQSYNLIYIAKLLRAFKVSIEFIFTLFFLKRLNINYLLILTIFTNLIVLVSFYFFLNKRFNFKISVKNFSFVDIVEHFRYSIWYFLNSLASVLVFNSQIILINYIVGSKAAAKFLVITRFFDIIRIAITNFTQVLTPQIIYIEQSLEWVRLKKLFINILKRIFTLTLIMSILIYYFGLPFFIKWSKLNDSETIKLFQMNILFISLIILDNVSFIFLSSLKLNKNTTIMSVIQGLINLALTYFFVNLFGIIGAIYASILSLVLTNLFFNPYFLLSKLNTKILFKNHN